MPCYRPLKAWRTTDDTVNGKKAIAFKKSANCTTPLNLPCGTCIGCKLSRSLVWAIRCVHESQLHVENSFITLTYAPEHLPLDGSLLKSHCQNFIKKLRRTYPSKTIRYYMCGEYGENLSRPHYHFCLFGLDFPDKEIYKESEGIITYQSATLENTWGKGFCTIGELNFDTAAYTARYITKKINGQKADDHYTTTSPITGDLIHLQPEYTTMSRKPGIAADWYNTYKTDLYPSDTLIHNAIPVKIPRFYDNLLERENPELLEEQKIKRKKMAQRHLKDNTPDRLADREKVKQLKFKQLKRNYENDTQNVRNL